MIKIMYILSDNAMGGATISFLNMVLNLDKSCYRPVVVIPKKCKDTEFNNILKNNGIVCYKAKLVASIQVRFCINTCLHWLIRCIYLQIEKFKSKQELESLTRKICPDIIHTNVGVIHEGFHVAQKYNIPHVWHLREYQTRDFNWSIYPSYKKFCSYLRKSYVISITNDILNYFGLQNQINAFTLYNGIFNENEIVKIGSKEKYFLIASRISPEKQHGDVIRAFAGFSKRYEYKLKILGFGNEKYISELRDLADKCDCRDSVEFLGFIKDVKPYMANAKALIVASNNEGFGRMTAEAAFCGTMVIGRNTAGTKEILDSTGGLIFNSIEEMTCQMELISEMDDETYKQSALKAQKTASSLYSIENNVVGITNLYSSIINNEK